MSETRTLKGLRTLMRVHVEEHDKHEGKPVYEVVVETLRRQHMAGAIAFRAVEGFGGEGEIHPSGRWSLKLDAPVIIECIDTDGNIQTILPALDRVIAVGVITLEQVRVIMHRQSGYDPADEDSAVDVTGSWAEHTGS